MAINDKLEMLQNEFGYRFSDLKLLRIALTHKSYAYELNNKSMDLYNERLEFLGDAIIEHIISLYLYKISPMLDEGTMTKKRAEIVCEKSLSTAFRNIKGENYVFLGKCELATNGKAKDAILADAFESLIAAIYLDSNFETATKIAIELLKNQIELSLAGKNVITDYKTLLQEELQKKGNIDIEYIVCKEEGPDHDKTFFVEVKLNKKTIGSGTGKNRKQAEQKAAEEAYAKYL